MNGISLGDDVMSLGDGARLLGDDVISLGDDVMSGDDVIAEYKTKLPSNRTGCVFIYIISVMNV